MLLVCYCRSNENLELLPPGEACWWTIHPASKQRSEGEKVRVGDDLILVSVATERYLVSSGWFGPLQGSVLGRGPLAVKDGVRLRLIMAQLLHLVL